MQASGDGLTAEAGACEVVPVVIVVSRSGHATAQRTSTRLCVFQFYRAEQPKATMVRVAKDDYDGECRRLGDIQALGMKPGIFVRIRRHPDIDAATCRPEQTVLTRID